MANIKEMGERFAWVETLKTGDKVAMSTRHVHGHPPYTIMAVERTTPTQIVTADGRRYAKKSLYEIGGNSNAVRRTIQPVTPKIKEEVETYRLARWLESLVTNFGRTHPPLHLMRAMKAAYDLAAAGQQETGT
jgi:hypothetical protein